MTALNLANGFHSRQWLAWRVDFFERRHAKRAVVLLPLLLRENRNLYLLIITRLKSQAKFCTKAHELIKETVKPINL